MLEPTTDAFRLPADEVAAIRERCRTDGMTDLETDAAIRYEAATYELAELFYGLDLDPDDLTDPNDRELPRQLIHHLPDTLRRWWWDIDSLDAELFGEAFWGGNQGTPAARQYYAAEVNAWLDARQNLLFAVAQDAGLSVPHPEHDSGELETSSRPAGFIHTRLHTVFDLG